MEGGNSSEEPIAVNQGNSPSTFSFMEENRTGCTAFDLVLMEVGFILFSLMDEYIYMHGSSNVLSNVFIFVTKWVIQSVYIPPLGR